ncbi:hypothetical protein BABINDRAFT_166757 [Babjeviella inositovora NRRL Y-12698]|uniref:FAD/NAD(P)-binding domain-containing protein n=1 Tax=Babjeviella inositovora NRRL Y-12698 TaxID=984486 RepID=A0A1E3QRT6_9ASCO|nr:uncharacterized protein BABINDRAFT_166757 [Babjeviella inositovora NRRL Y-12698]ODQ80426.1 hypothetical protein BABINDRAFT_166757 [Babjeviella inositovora NRRL Y-12698]
MKQIIIIGGSYAGLSALKALVGKLSPSLTSATSVTITLLEPKTGIINLLGLPKSIVDSSFADDIYSPLHQYNMKFDSIRIADKEDGRTDITATKLSLSNQETHSEFLTVNFIQTKCSKLTAKEAHYVDPVSNQPAILKFDYCVLASGRARPDVPFDPISKAHHICNKEDFLKQQRQQQDLIEKANTVTVIGGGALGIETAGELLQQYGKVKKIRLIHPYPRLLPEPVLKNDEFRDKILEQLVKLGCEVLMELRVVAERANGNLKIQSPKGEYEIESELNYWCHSYVNNLEPLSNNLELFEDCLTGKEHLNPKRRCANVNEFLQLAPISDPKNLFEKIYAVGDLVALPILKTSGGAVYMGGLAAGNIAMQILGNSEDLTEFPLSQWPPNMAVVVGTKVTLQVVDGVVVVNDKSLLAMYADYCTSRFGQTINIEFGSKRV